MDYSLTVSDDEQEQKFTVRFGNGDEDVYDSQERTASDNEVEIIPMDDSQVEPAGFSILVREDEELRDPHYNNTAQTPATTTPQRKRISPTAITSVPPVQSDVDKTSDFLVVKTFEERMQKIACEIEQKIKSGEYPVQEDPQEIINLDSDDEEPKKQASKIQVPKTKTKKTPPKQKKDKMLFWNIGKRSLLDDAFWTFVNPETEINVTSLSLYDEEELEIYHIVLPAAERINATYWTKMKDALALLEKCLLDKHENGALHYSCKLLTFQYAIKKYMSSPEDIKDWEKLDGLIDSFQKQEDLKTPEGLLWAFLYIFVKQKCHVENKDTFLTQMKDWWRYTGYQRVIMALQSVLIICRSPGTFEYIDPNTTKDNPCFAIPWNSKDSNNAPKEKALKALGLSDNDDEIQALRAYFRVGVKGLKIVTQKQKRKKDSPSEEPKPKRVKKSAEKSKETFTFNIIPLEEDFTLDHKTLVSKVPRKNQKVFWYPTSEKLIGKAFFGPWDDKNKQLENLMKKNKLAKAIGIKHLLEPEVYKTSAGLFLCYNSGNLQPNDWDYTSKKRSDRRWLVVSSKEGTGTYSAHYFNKLEEGVLRKLFRSFLMDLVYAHVMGAACKVDTIRIVNEKLYMILPDQNPKICSEPNTIDVLLRGSCGPMQASINALIVEQKEQICERLKTLLKDMDPKKSPFKGLFTTQGPTQISKNIEEITPCIEGALLLFDVKSEPIEDPLEDVADEEAIESEMEY